MDKQTFLAIASRLYDEMFENVLFKDEPESPALPSTEIIPYRAKEKTQFIRIGNISAHYRVASESIANICDQLGIRIVRNKGNDVIGREDLDLLLKVISKKYNNFND